ncbi:hypothetical protein J6590_076497 [Homalodisca vitripennis]|nr:hypothetical protein J6590_076497 [Homalodisca vitripennis]
MGVGKASRFRPYVLVLGLSLMRYRHKIAIVQGNLHLGSDHLQKAVDIRGIGVVTNNETGRNDLWTVRLIGDLKKWMDAKEAFVNVCLTQILTGYKQPLSLSVCNGQTQDEANDELLTYCEANLLIKHVVTIKSGANALV